ncbi:MAG: hypothetical protein WCG80_05205 [Spirochaetales bacterium]
MRLFAFTLLLLFPVGVAFAQSPQAAFSYDDRAGTTGHTLVVEGKSFGPYKDVLSMTYSSHGKTAIFLVNKRDKTYVLAQGKETGPFAAGFSEESVWVADDSKFWAVSLVAYPEQTEGEDTTGSTQAQLLVNGKTYGPYLSVAALDFADSGGSWIASVQVAEDQYTVMLNGKPQGTFQSVSNLWMSPDGKLWGFAGDKDDQTLVFVNQDQVFPSVQEYNVYGLDFRAPHWAYSVRTSEEEETVVVDGKTLPSFLHFEGFLLTASGRHWGFGAQKLTETGDYPVVVIDGQEFIGEGLSVNRAGSQEFFTWTVRDGNKTTVQVLSFQ